MFVPVSVSVRAVVPRSEREAKALNRSGVPAAPEASIVAPPALILKSRSVRLLTPPEPSKRSVPTVVAPPMSRLLPALPESEAPRPLPVRPFWMLVIVSVPFRIWTGPAKVLAPVSFQTPVPSLIRPVLLLKF